MGRTDLSVTIARPVEDVFAVLTDPTQSPKWSANAIEAELITPGPPYSGCVPGWWPPDTGRRTP